MAVVSEVRAAVITADHVLTFSRLRLLGVLAMADLAQKCLMLELCLDLTLLFLHGAFV